MDNPMLNFRSEAEKIRVAPPVRAWNSIEASLDSRRARRNLARARLLNYAASIMLLVGLGFFGVYMMNVQNVKEMQAYSDSFQQLTIEDTNYGIYDIQSVKQVSMLTAQLK